MSVKDIGNGYDDQLVSIQCEDTLEPLSGLGIQTTLAAMPSQTLNDDRCDLRRSCFCLSASQGPSLAVPFYPYNLCTIPTSGRWLLSRPVQQSERPCGQCRETY